MKQENIIYIARLYQELLEHGGFKNHSGDDCNRRCPGCYTQSDDKLIHAHWSRCAIKEYLFLKDMGAIITMEKFEELHGVTVLSGFRVSSFFCGDFLKFPKSEQLKRVNALLKTISNRKNENKI